MYVWISSARLLSRSYNHHSILSVFYILKGVVSENEDETDTAQQADSIEEQYAMHLQRGKQIRKELLERLSNGSGGPGQVRFHQQQ